MAGLIASALAGGLTGAAEAGGKAMFEQMKSDLEEQKTLRIAEATEARKNAPMERFSGLVSAKMGEQVPVEAAPAAQYSSGQGLDPSRTPDLIARINALPDSNPDKAPMLAQLQSQLEANQKTEQEKVAGKTKPRTFDEAVESARQESALSDAAAFNAGESMFAEDRKNKIANKKDEAANRRLDIQEEYTHRREDRLDRLASAQLAFQQVSAGKQDSRAEQAAAREERSATVAAMKGAEADIKQLQRDLADPMLAPEQKSVLQSQLDVSRADARRYRNALGGAGIEVDNPLPKAEVPTDATIAKLKANPAKAADFDTRFGAGSSDKYLKPPAAAVPVPAAAPAAAEKKGLVNASMSTSNEEAVAKAKASNPYFQKAAPEQIASAEKAVREAQSNLDAASSNAQKIQLNSALRVAKNKLEELQSKGK